MNIVRRFTRLSAAQKLAALNPAWWLGRLRDQRAADAEAREVLASFPFDRSQDFTAVRRARLQQILQYAERHCEFWRAAIADANVDVSTLANFERLPLLDKTTIREQRSAMTSNQLQALWYYHSNTGGSTGEPLAFPMTGFAGLIDRAHQLALYRQHGYVDGEPVVALDGVVVPLRSIQKGVFWVENPTGDIPYGRLSYSAYHFNKENAPRYLAHMQQLGPRVIRGYPSLVSFLAHSALQHGVRLRPRVVVLTAEQTFPNQLENIRDAFDCDVVQQYGHAEASVFAYGQTYEPLVCSPYYGHVEVLDASGAHVPHGQSGEVVVTGFLNRALPFIRYRTGDTAVFEGTELGVTRIRLLEGRTQEYLVTASGERLPVTAIHGQHLTPFSKMQRWQLVQREPGRVIIRIQHDEKFSQDDEAAMANSLASVNGLSCSVEHVEEFALTPAGKFRFVVNELVAGSAVTE